MVSSVPAVAGLGDPKLEERIRARLEGSEALATANEDNKFVAGFAKPPTLAFSDNAFSRSSGRYMISTGGGQAFVGLRKSGAVMDPRVGALSGATIMRFGEKRFGLVSPIVLDLDGNGLDLRSRAQSHARFDMDGDGIRDDTGWVGRRDGILVVDRNGDGLVTSASEISFLTDKPGAKSDLEGLSALDSNHDGSIDASDSRFAELKIWVDSNGNGVSDPGELASLADHSIKSLSLDALGTDTSVKIGSNVVLSTATFTREDGSTGTLGDVALAFKPSSHAGAGATLSVLAPAPAEDETGTEPSAPGGRALRRGPLPSSPDLAADQAADFTDAAGGPLAQTSSDRGEETDYTARSGANAEEPWLTLANARLIQAMSTFGDSAGMMQRFVPDQSGPDRSDWLSVASMPTVQHVPSLR